MELWEANQPKIFCSIEALKTKFSQIEAIVFDWDGVFNRGDKSHEMHSDFSEVDSMGTNLLRYCIWKLSGKLPRTFVVTGQQNKTAIAFAERECFDAIAPGVKYKYEVFAHLAKTYNFNEKNSIFFFDDVLDLSINEKAGISVQIRHEVETLFDQFVIENNLVTIKSNQQGGSQAIREVCDFLLAISGIGKEVIEGRMHFNENYQAYWAARQNIKTVLISKEDLKK